MSGDVLCDLLNRTGSIDYAVSVAREYVERAVRSLETLPSSSARSSLAALAEFIIARRF
jgi:geranylgeranyl pyrophosphate synthase